MCCIYHHKKKKEEERKMMNKNQKRYQIVKNILQKMGCNRKNQFMAQQVSETIYTL